MHEFYQTLELSLPLWNLAIDNMALDAIHLLVKLVTLVPDIKKRYERLAEIAKWKERMMNEGIKCLKSSSESLLYHQFC